MKTTPKAAAMTLTTIFGLTFSPAYGALTMTINEYTQNVLSITIGGTLDAETYGDRPGYIGIKNNWHSSQGVHTEMFSATPTITLNTVKFGNNDSMPYADNQTRYAWNDSISFRDATTSAIYSLAAGTEIAGTIRLEGNGIFDPSDASTLALVSGLASRGTISERWLRLEASAVPEPATFMALLLGGLSLVLRRSRG